MKVISVVRREPNMKGDAAFKSLDRSNFWSLWKVVLFDSGQ